MDSYLNILQHKRRRFESPAKVFAKLKSKVQREEGLWAKEGTFLANGPLCNVSEKHGAIFKSPRKRAESIWMTDELKENPRSGSYRNEAQALTLSPLSSPQKTFEYSDLSSAQVSAIAPVTEMGHGGIPRKRAFMESTTLSHQSFLVNRKQIHTEPPHVRDSAAFRGISRTPVKLQPVEDDYVSSVFEERRAPLDKRMSPACVLSPTRKRGKWEPLDFNKVSRGSKEVSNESTSQPKERKTSSAVSEDCSTSVEDVGNVRGFSVPPTEMDEVTYEPVFSSPGPTLLKRSFVALEKMPIMSPAKMFALMKKRENKPKPQEVHEVTSSTTDPFHAGNSHQSRDTPPPSTPHKMFEMEDIVFRNLPENVVIGNRSRVESADCQSNTDSSEDVLSPAVPSQPILLIDPLVLNSPHISIPKKQDAVFKRRNWPQSTKYPRESVIYLKKWFLRGSRKGLFVDGIHQEENIPWNSNIIVERVSSNVVKTVSHKVYVLVGKMNMSVDSGLPKWLLKEFVNGFPPNWETLYESFMSKSDSDKEIESKTKGRGVTSKKKSEASSSIRSAKQHRRNSVRTPDSCPPASSSRLNVSRSGRVIKPPLEYWKGGRVILDAHMNVTIHECYDTSICIPEISTKMSTRASQKPARGFLPCSEGRKRFDSASDKEASVASRRVKAPLRKRASAKVQPEKKPSYSPDPPVETLNSPEQWSGRPTMSSQRSRVTNTTLYVDTVPQKQSEPDSPVTTRSKKQTHNIPRSSVRVMSRKQVVPAPESGNDVVIEKKKPGKEVHRKRSRRVLNKSRPSLFPSSESSNSSDEIEKELGTQTKHKWNKCTKSSSPTKPLPKSAQSSKKKGKATKGNAPVPQEQDADEWTEAELKMLQEAASYYPKHMAGYWAKVARMVGTRSAEECNYQHTSQAASQTPAKKAKKPMKEAAEAPKGPDQPVISARVGTFKRKQQVRQFLETMPREDVEDVFSSAYMQNKRYEMPSMCPSEHDFTLSEMQPLTPKSTGFPEVKTPQCLHITPGMMGSPNRDNDDKYVYQLQKRMKKNQFNVCKQAPPSKSFTPTPSVKRTMRRCGNTENDTFLVWEMFPGNDGALSESGEEEDFYFSDND